MPDTMQISGLTAIKLMFDIAHSNNRAAFLPYFPIGYPTYEDSLDAIEKMAKAGVDGFEIGVPFSDPLADGPTIQAASQVALENGINLEKSLEAIRELRRRRIKQPMLVFSYLNPLLAYGADHVVEDARKAGANGFIIPDLPPEEAHLFADACQHHNMALVFFLAPTSNSERIRLVAANATGFIYVVALTGITGARAELPTDLSEFIARLRAETTSPLVMGFGISKPEHARMMNGLLDGFIVGSALVRAAEDGVDAVYELAKSLRDALEDD